VSRDYRTTDREIHVAVTVSEVSLALWLALEGVDNDRWRAQAAAAQTLT